MIRRSTYGIRIIPDVTVLTPLIFERDILRELNAVKADCSGKVIEFDLTSLTDADLFSLLGLAVAAHDLVHIGNNVCRFLFRRFTVEAIGNANPDLASFARAVNDFYYVARAWGLLQALFTSGFDVRVVVEREVRHDTKRPSSPELYDPRNDHAINSTDSAITTGVIRSIRTRSEFEAVHGFIGVAFESLLNQHGIDAAPQEMEDFRKAVVYEICENVYLHSGITTTSGVGLIALRYVPSPLKQKLTLQSYSEVAWLEHYFKNHLEHGYFDLVVADSGIGMHASLGPKLYPDTYKAVLEEDIVLQAFKEHRFLPSSQTRRGLLKVASCLEEWSGLISLRSGSTLLSQGYGRAQDLKYLVTGHIHKPLSGVQLHVIFPAKFEHLKKLYPLGSEGISFTSGLGSTAARRRFRIRREAAADVLNDRRIFGGEDVEQRLLNQLTTAFVELDDDQLLLVDFANLEVKNTALERVIEAIALESEGHRHISRLIVAAKQPILRSLASSATAELLRRNDLVLLGLNETEQPVFIGPDNEESLALTALYSQGRIGRDNLRATTHADITKIQAFCVANGVWLWSWSEGTDEYYSFADLEDALTTNFHRILEKAIQDSGALHRGHFKLLSQFHSDEFLEVRLLLQDTDLAFLIGRQIAKHVKGHIDTIFSYSVTGAILSHHVQPLIGAKRFVLGRDYENLSAVFGDEIREGESVLILTDVVGSGSLIKRMQAHVIEKGAHVVQAIVVVNTQTESLEDRVKALFDYPFEKHPDTDCQLCQEGNPVTDIDPLTLCPRWEDREPEPPAPNGTKDNSLVDIGDRIQSHLHQAKGIYDRSLPFWDMIERSNAVSHGHIVRTVRHFEWYTRTERILADQQALKEIKARMFDFSQCFDAMQVDTVLHPDNLSATIFAHNLAAVLQTPTKVICATRIGHREYFVASGAIQGIGKNVLIVDDAANSGSTIFELYGLVQMFGGQVLAAYVLMNRLTPKLYRAVRGLLADRFAYVYRLRSPIYLAGECPLCKEREALEADLGSCRTHAARKFLQNRIIDLEETPYSES